MVRVMDVCPLTNVLPSHHMYNDNACVYAAVQEADAQLLERNRIREAEAARVRLEAELANVSTHVLARLSNP
jgi:hypothetical protein